VQPPLAERPQTFSNWMEKTESLNIIFPKRFESEIWCPTAGNFRRQRRVPKNNCCKRGISEFTFS